MEEETPIEEKDDSKTVIGIVVGILVIIGLIFSVGYFYNPVQEKNETTIIEYNNFQFIKIAGVWNTQWQKGNELYTIPLRFNPLELEDLEIEGELSEAFIKDKIYVTFDPEQENLSYVALGVAELSINLAQVLDITPIGTCTKNVTEACQIREIVTCDSEDKAVIELINAEETKVIFDGNCIKVQGKDMNLLKSVDRILYLFYGIME